MERGTALCGAAEVLPEMRIVIQRALRIDSSALTEDCRLIEGGLALGSLQLIELVVGIEEHFDISLDADLLAPENFATIGTVCALVRKVREDALAKAG